MKIKIVKDNKPSLRIKSKEVVLPLSKEDAELVKSMSDYLKLSQDEEYAKKHNIRSGVGLAAPQVGVNKRIFVVYFEENNKPTHLELINPKITEYSAKKAALKFGEGCLSVDKDHPGLVHRSYKIKIKGFNLLTGKEEEYIFSGYPAIVIQHEYDHLDGVLFYDRINPFNPNGLLPGEVEI
jgi:peptide deformylase